MVFIAAQSQKLTIVLNVNIILKKGNCKNSSPSSLALITISGTQSELVFVACLIALYETSPSNKTS